MSNTSNLELFAASVDGESHQTPARQSSNTSRMTLFSPRALSGDIRFTPSAWKTPKRSHTGETPFKLGTPEASPSGLFGTPGAYRAAASTSQTPRGVPGLHQTPMGNVGVTPARVMGPFPRRDMFFETTTSPSPISWLGHRRIYTPKALREKHAPGSLEEGDGSDLVRLTSFLPARTDILWPARRISLWYDRGTEPQSRSTIQPTFGSLWDTGPSPHTLLALFIPPTPTTSPPLEAAPGQSDVAAVDGMDSDGEEEAETEEHGEGEDEDEGVTHHTQSLTIIHSQPGAQNESTDDDGNVWLPFPYDRSSLAAYLERGLSLRYLFPSSTQGHRIRCEAELELVGGLWRHADTCNESKGSLESYQRHIKSKHLGVKRGKEVGLGHIVNTVWGCNKTLPRQPKAWLRVQRWVPNLPGFQLAAVAPPASE